MTLCNLLPTQLTVRRNNHAVVVRNSNSRAIVALHEIRTYDDSHYACATRRFIVRLELLYSLALIIQLVYIVYIFLDLGNSILPPNSPLFSQQPCRCVCTIYEYTLVRQ